MRSLASAAVGLTLLLALPLAVPAAAPVQADAVGDYVRGVMAKRKIPGVAVLIARRGEIVLAKGYGSAHLEHAVAVTEETLFQSGSVGKQFTAAGILLLAEEGRLALDDPLARHFPGGPSSWHRITVRHLLTHTSGLKDYGADEIDLRKDYEERDLLRVMQKLPLEFEPGTQWSYSNSGYLILGLLTSKLAGMHWSDFQAERIFTPLGMSTTRVISERDVVPHRAAGYELDHDGEVKNQEWVSPTLNRCADGALYFSLRDLAAWERALTERKFLRPESFTAWWTPVELADGGRYPYGFGWALSEQRGQPVIEHGGSWQGFRAMIARYPEQGLTVSVLANLAQAEPETMAHEIAGLVEPALRLRSPDPVTTSAQPGSRAADRRASPESIADDPDPARTARLLEVLEAWSSYGKVPSMARGLAATASASAREASDRARTGTRLEESKGFRYLGEDDLSAHPVPHRGEKVLRAVDCVLETAKTRFIYRFLLAADGRVVDFSSEER